MVEHTRSLIYPVDQNSSIEFKSCGCSFHDLNLTVQTDEFFVFTVSLVTCTVAKMCISLHLGAHSLSNSHLDFHQGTKDVLCYLQFHLVAAIGLMFCPILLEPPSPQGDTILFGVALPPLPPLYLLLVALNSIPKVSQQDWPLSGTEKYFFRPHSKE